MKNVQPLLILCLGNEVVSDDRLGYEIWLRLSKCALPEDVEALFEPAAGFRLLDLLSGRRRVLIVDAIITGSAPPGALHFFPAGHLTPSRQLTSSHQINLPTALELGRMMDIPMPDKIDVLAVEAEDVTTLKEALTEPVAMVVPEVVQKALDWIKDSCS
ncbi:MAG: hydrogenase maturation protease [Calditrichaeota bacterium]|nr:hydrogenase maturation protease [Calditrichota bacterium]